MTSYLEILLKTRGFEKEFRFSASSSSGPGGQHVNKRATKIELRFSIETSECLSEVEKNSIKTKLSNFINNEGELIIVSQETRSALRNRLRCKQKFYELLSEALIPEKKRKIKGKPASYHRKRLEIKKQKSDKKRRRHDDKDISI